VEIVFDIEIIYIYGYGTIRSPIYGWKDGSRFGKIWVICDWDKIGVVIFSGDVKFMWRSYRY